MILVDTGPLVALFDPRDDAHAECRRILQKQRLPLITTAPVLTEAFHLLAPDSQGSVALRAFVSRGGLGLWFFTDATFRRALELMEQYVDHPMDLADASLVAAAEERRATMVFTLDRGDFASYRARVGRAYKGFQFVD